MTNHEMAAVCDRMMEAAGPEWSENERAVFCLVAEETEKGGLASMQGHAGSEVARLAALCLATASAIVDTMPNRAGLRGLIDLCCQKIESKAWEMMDEKEGTPQ